MPEPSGTLHLVSHLPAGGGTCALYAPGARPPPGWHAADIRERCHRHQDEWRVALASWHAGTMEVASVASAWAWLLPGSRIHVWQPQIRPLLFALGLHDFFRDHPDTEVWACGCPPEVADYIREFTNGALRIVEHTHRSQASGAPGPLRDTLSILRRLPMRARAPILPAGVDLVACSLALSERSVRERGDHFFGRALDDGVVSVHWLYHLVGSGERAAIEAALRQTGRSVTWVHDCVGWGGALALLLTMRSVRRRMRSVVDRIPPLRIAGVTSQAFARRYADELLVRGALLGELLVFRATLAVLRAARPPALCYPYEEKGMEHGILLGVQTAATGCRTIGFAHAAYASGYLYLQTPPSNTSRPWPQVIASAGRGFGAWLQREFGRQDAVTFVGSPRWTPAPPTALDHVPGRPLRVLVLASFAYELQVMADWIDAQPDLFDGMTVTVRPNPKDWRREQVAALQSLRGSAVAIDGESSLEAQIDACDVAIFCATSAVAEAIWRGRIAVYAEWSDLWATNPTSGKEGEQAVPACATAGDLRHALLEIGRMDRAAYARAVDAQREVAAQIYAPFDRARFRELVRQPVPA